MEQEAKLTGVKGKAAFFLRQIEQAGDRTKSNEQKVRC